MTLDDVVFRAVCSLEAYLKKDGLDLVSSISPFDPPDYSGIKAKMKEWISEAVRAANVWIPVSERLPDDDEMMLVTCRAKNGNVSVNRAYYMDGCWHGSGSMAGVTAWMPLPEPYKEADA